MKNNPGEKTEQVRRAISVLKTTDFVARDLNMPGVHAVLYRLEDAGEIASAGVRRISGRNCIVYKAVSLCFSKSTQDGESTSPWATVYPEFFTDPCFPGAMRVHRSSDEDGGEEHV